MKVQSVQVGEAFSAWEEIFRATYEGEAMPQVPELATLLWVENEAEEMTAWAVTEVSFHGRIVIFGVLPPFRHEAIAASSLTCLLKELARRGVNHVMWTLPQENVVMQKIALSSGFRFSGMFTQDDRSLIVSFDCPVSGESSLKVEER